MGTYYIKQKVFSFKDSFSVFDATAGGLSCEKQTLFTAGSTYDH
ncbi:hypothetical protein [Terribacillus saccharophilus]|nr:hypothetical protein [Terribacillus saccharophilus]